MTAIEWGLVYWFVAFAVMISTDELQGGKDPQERIPPLGIAAVGALWPLIVVVIFALWIEDD